VGRRLISLRGGLLAGLVVVLVAVPSPAVAQEAGACSKVVAPGGSVQRLADLLAPGEVGCLRAGTYTEAVTVSNGGAPGQPLTLRSYPGEVATLIGRLVIQKSANHVTVEQLVLDGQNRDRLPSPTVNGDHVTFRLNDVTNSHSAICFVIGASNVDNSVKWGRAQDTLIEGNRIHGCGVLPAANHDHGIYVEGADDTRIQGNWIYDNADRGVQLYPDAQRSVVIGNVIDGNGTGVVFSGEGGATSNDNLVAGNVITNSRLRPNVESWWGGPEVGRGNVLRDNCVSGGPRDDGNGGINAADGGFSSRRNRAAAPGFVNRAAKDFRLAPDSPCRSLHGAANNVPGVGGSVPVTARRAARRPALRLRVRPGFVRHGRRTLIRGHVDLKRVKSGRRVTILARGKRGRHVIGRSKVLAGGAFRLTRRLHPHGRTVRLVAVVRGVGRSRAVRLHVRR
jgi:parallel beta-helix repeat protein